MNDIDFEGDIFKKKLLKMIKRNENAKFDRKLKYEFKAKEKYLCQKEKFEFIKDVCSIANSFPKGVIGEDGYIVIGVNNRGTIKGIRKGDYQDTDFTDLINEYVEPTIQIQYSPVKTKGGWLGVIYIPKSYNVPHFIKRQFSIVDKKERERIVAQEGICFIRNGSKIYHAKKDYFDELYNIKLEEREAEEDAKKIEGKAKRLRSEGDVDKLIKNYEKMRDVRNQLVHGASQSIIQNILSYFH